MNMKRCLGALCTAIAVVVTPVVAAEVHGQTDVFTAPGVALAWAIARGPDEARTFVVVRVLTERAIRTISLTGRDPFTQAEKTLMRTTPTKGRVDVRIPRGSFADFPRTEWQFFASEKEPRLVVFYLGVPDTTPEFADETGLDAYLDERLAKAR